MSTRAFGPANRSGERFMDEALTKETVRAFLRVVRLHLDKIVGIARAAEICAEIGQTDKAVRLSLDIEPLLYEVRTLTNAASLINRLWGT